MGWQKLPVPERDILLCVVYDWSMYPRFILSIGSNLFGCNAKLAGSREERGARRRGSFKEPCGPQTDADL